MNSHYMLNSLATDKAFDNSEFKTNSKNQLLDESFGECRKLSESSSTCTFCSSKQSIMKQLRILEEVIESKNSKIKELEQFIHRLSQMVLFESTQSAMYGSEQAKQKQEKTHSSVRSSFQSNSSAGIFVKENSKVQECRDNSRPSSSANFSRINSQLTAFEAEDVRFEIKKQIEKMDLDRGQITKGFPSPKESRLKNKLIEIINILPNLNNSGMHEFESLSEPFSEGLPGSINQKLNFKGSKTPNFLKQRGSYESVSEASQLYQ